MRIGVKPGQMGMNRRELVECWKAADELGFESIWTFDHLSGPRRCLEALSLLAAMSMVTTKARIGCLVLANGLRSVGSLAGQIATIDHLSDGRLEIGLGAGDAFANADFVAFGQSMPPRSQRVNNLASTVDELRRLLSTHDLLAAGPAPEVPLILGGASKEIRALTVDRNLSWNYSGDVSTAARFAEFAHEQPDPQAQVFVSNLSEAGAAIDAFGSAGATRLVLVLSAPISTRLLGELARLAHL